MAHVSGYHCLFSSGYLPSIREVLIGDNIHPASMLQLRCDVRQEHMCCILRDGLCITWCQDVDDGCSIKDKYFNSRTASILLWRDQTFQATNQVRLFSSSISDNLIVRCNEMIIFLTAFPTEKRLSMPASRALTRG